MKQNNTVFKEVADMKSQDSIPTSSLAYALAWKKYLQSGEINCEVIKPPIAESWKRCHEASVNRWVENVSTYSNAES